MTKEVPLRSDRAVAGHERTVEDYRQSGWGLRVRSDISDLSGLHLSCLLVTDAVLALNLLKASSGSLATLQRQVAVLGKCLLCLLSEASRRTRRGFPV